MASPDHWTVPAALRPKPADYAYDLDRALAAVVSLSAQVPPDAFTAEVLGTERAGNGVLIRDDGLVLTIGYLIAEAESVWLTTGAGRVVPAHALAYDYVSGFGLVQALGRLDIPELPLGDSDRLAVKDRVVVAGAGGRAGAVAARLVARQEFAGYWEYVLDEALFTAPAHPHWGGAALIGPEGDLLGIGSLQLQQAVRDGDAVDINMIVPSNLLGPILDDLVRFGRQAGSSRPWLGLYATEIDNKIVVMSTATGGPAEEAGLESGDVILAVAGRAVGALARFFRRVWALGEAGVEVPLTIHRGGKTFDVRIASADRARFLKAPRMH